MQATMQYQVAEFAFWGATLMQLHQNYTPAQTNLARFITSRAANQLANTLMCELLACEIEANETNETKTI
jgi:hypothetical protein